MWLFRILKWLFKLWMGSGGAQGRLVRMAGTHIISLILRNLKNRPENGSHFIQQEERTHVRQKNTAKARQTPKTDYAQVEKGVKRIGLVLLGVMVIVALLILGLVLWATSPGGI